MRAPFKRSRMRTGAAIAASGALAIAAAVTSVTVVSGTAHAAAAPTTPIKHVVVIFDENESYDHYFGTYPQVSGTGTPFTAAADTPANQNLVSDDAITNNPNTTKPFLLTHDQAVTCSQNHAYTPEQKAVNGGAMDQFVQNTSSSATCGSATQYGQSGLSMGYYDGHTVTGLWNYAQNYSMSDNSWDVGFGPSTPGALNLISGNTGNSTAYTSSSSYASPTVSPNSTALASVSNGNGTVIADPDPVYDDCSDTDHTSTNDVVAMQGKNVGDLLNTAGLTWGWFQGGFTPTTAWDGTDGHYAKCDKVSYNVMGGSSKDYSPHHNPFEYYQSTSNPHHLAPTSDAMIGHTDQANHQYDLTAFTTALQQDNLPAVSYLKAAQKEDAHPGNSDPIDEQNFLTREINAIQASPEWSSTMIVISYDDSDGWYDHVAPTIINGSNDTAGSTVVDQTICTTAAAAAATAAKGGIPDRCGPSQRLPLVVISPYSRQNYIDHTHVDQTSVLSFIEQNWGLGRIGDDSFDEDAGSIEGMLDFQNPQQRAVLLKSDGEVSTVKQVAVAPAGGFATTTSETVHGASFGTPSSVTVHVASEGDVTGGLVTLSIGGEDVATATLESATQTIDLPADLAVGTHSVVATFGGSSDSMESTSDAASVTVTKAPTVASVVISTHSPRAGSTKLHAAVHVVASGTDLAPTGVVKITVDDVAVTANHIAATADGRITVILPVIKTKGTHHIRAVFVGTGGFDSVETAPITIKAI